MSAPSSARAVFCTYFDHRYLPRGLALYDSLAHHAGSFTLWVLCLDEISHSVLSEMGLPGLRLISLAELERDDPALLAAKANRSLVEYYFTCTPSLALYVLGHDSTANLVTYVDADFWFTHDVSPIFDEFGSASIAITGHCFPPGLRHLERYGIYNVGLLMFRRDSSGLECLHWWRERCLEWCYDRIDGTRFADQGYLNDWPERFHGVKILRHRGVNVAPWNLADRHLERIGHQVRADGQRLICFHFHGLKRPLYFFYDLGLQPYGVIPNRVFVNHVAIPYLSRLSHLTAEVESRIRAASQRNSRRFGGETTALDRISTPRKSMPIVRDSVHIARGLPRRQVLVNVGGHIF